MANPILDINTVWVVSTTDKPVHHIERKFDNSREFVRIDIDKKMAKEKIPVLMPKTDGFMNLIDLELVKICKDRQLSKKQYDDFFKNTPT